MTDICTGPKKCQKKNRQTLELRAPEKNEMRTPSLAGRLPVTHDHLIAHWDGHDREHYERGEVREA